MFIFLLTEGKGLFIASIDLDPALSDGRLKVGDEILKVHNYEWSSHEHMYCTRTDQWSESSGCGPSNWSTNYEGSAG